MQPPAPAPPPDRLAERLVGALLAAADTRGEPVAVTEWTPPLYVAALPGENAYVAVIDHADLTSDLEAACARLIARLVDAQERVLLYVVLVGGGPRERAALEAADRGAADPRRLGFYQLNVDATLVPVCGRRLALVARAGRRVADTAPAEPGQIRARMERVRGELREAAAFAADQRGQPPWASRALGAACIVLFGLAWLWSARGTRLVLVDMGANVSLLAAHEPWRLLAHAFLHFNVLHLGMNMLGLARLGSFLEGVLGWRRFVLLYGLAALAGGVLSAFAATRPTIAAGASGAICGLLGAGLGLTLRRQSVLPRLMVAQLRPRLVAVAALNVVASFMRDVDWRAHAGGALIGLLLAGTGLLTRGQGAPVRTREPLLVRVGAVLMIALMAGAIGQALLVGRPWSPDLAGTRTYLRDRL